MASSVPYKQDLPPKGGYGPVTFQRKIPRWAKPGFGYKSFVGGFLFSAVGFFGLWVNNRIMRKREILEHDSHLALMPLIIVEQQRRILNRIKYNTEQERVIMKDVPGWVPGESVYNSKHWENPRIWDLYYLDPEADVIKRGTDYIMNV